MRLEDQTEEYGKFPDTLEEIPRGKLLVGIEGFDVMYRAVAFTPEHESEDGLYAMQVIISDLDMGSKYSTGQFTFWLPPSLFACCSLRSGDELPDYRHVLLLPPSASYLVHALQQSDPVEDEQ